MSVSVAKRDKSFAIAANRFVWGFSRHWLLIFSIIFGLYVGLPWLAPVFMKVGWSGAAQVIYDIYSTQCHQLPERSFFLFGEKSMYPLTQIQAIWRNTNDQHILRQFIGSEAMGWKVAWSDRMVSLYTTIFLVCLLYKSLRKYFKPMPTWVASLITLPMLFDVFSHIASDKAGIGNGFRDSNVWLVNLTGNSFPAWFYAGDSLGSFNSWMRLVTGVLFAIGSVWLIYPLVEKTFAEMAERIEAKFRKAGLSL
jgi:uncharacterized membrane protein